MAILCRETARLQDALGAESGGNDAEGGLSIEFSTPQVSD